MSGEEYVGEVKPIRPPMTQEQVEAWIMLKGQSGERWFKIEILDKQVGQDPTMIALMETVSEMIFAGIQGMPFLEAEQARQMGKKTDVAKGVRMGIVKPNGDPAA